MQEWTFYSNRMKRGYDLVGQVTTVMVHASMLANAIERSAESPVAKFYFLFVATRTVVISTLICRGSPWFLRHRATIYNVSQTLTASMYFWHILRIPHMLMNGTPDIPNRLPASGTVDRARFLLLLPMLELHVGLTGISTVRLKQWSLLVTLGLGLAASTVRCLEEATNSPASVAEYAKMVGNAETMVSSWVPALVLHSQEELSGAAACVAVNAGIQFSAGYFFPMAVMLIEVSELYQPGKRNHSVSPNPY